MIELHDKTHTDEQPESVQLARGKLYAGWTGDIRPVCDRDEGPGAQSPVNNYRRQNTQSKLPLYGPVSMGCRRAARDSVGSVLKGQ